MQPAPQPGAAPPAPAGAAQPGLNALSPTIQAQLQARIQAVLQAQMQSGQLQQHQLQASANHAAAVFMQQLQQQQQQQQTAAQLAPAPAPAASAPAPTRTTAPAPAAPVRKLEALPAVPRQAAQQPAHIQSQAQHQTQPAQQQQQQQQGQKKRKLAERQGTIEKVVLHIPESYMFNRLVDLDRRIADVLNHRRSDLKEAMQPPGHVKKILRLYVFHHHYHQPKHSGQGALETRQSGDQVMEDAAAAAPPSASTASAPATRSRGAAAEVAAAASTPSASAAQREPPAWSLHIGGRIMEPSSDPSKPPTQMLQGQKPHPLTWYLKRVEIQLDPKQYPGASGQIVWDRSQLGAAGFKDQLEVRRTGSSNVDVTIKVELDWQPERFVLPDALADVVGVRYETWGAILNGFWFWIMKNKMLDHRNPFVVTLPPSLEQLFGGKSVKLQELGNKLFSVLQPFPPQVITHTIKVDGPSTSLPDAYDFEIELPSANPSEPLLVSLLGRISKEKDLEGIDIRLSALVKKINEHRRRRALLLAFAQAPVEFTHALLSSQSRDLRVAAAAAPGGAPTFDIERRADSFKQSWVQDAVTKYVHKRLGAGH